jgi:hypothetical protein
MIEIYVTELFPVRTPTRKFPGKEYCILIAQAPKEGVKPTEPVIAELSALHSFAKRIGMKTEWYQNNHYCYNLTPNKRDQALREGAKPITKEAWGELISQWRQMTAMRRHFNYTLGARVAYGKAQKNRR